MSNEIGKKIDKLMNLASELKNEGKSNEVIEVYLKIIEIEPNWSVPYYNIGLIYKYRQDWGNSFKFNLKAAEIDPKDQPTWWNMGIAATALSDWPKARFAWEGFGLKLPKENAALELRLKIGITPIRLTENSEVVWAERIDPARAIIQNVPTGNSKRRFRDIILNDGAPNGTRKNGKSEYPVFDEIALFKASDYATFSIWVETNDKKSLEILEKKCEENDLGFENWTHTIRPICKQCSEGTPHEHHDKSLEKTVSDGQYNIAIAAKTEREVKRIIMGWEKETLSQVIDFEQVM